MKNIKKILLLISFTIVFISCSNKDAKIKFLEIISSEAFHTHGDLKNNKYFMDSKLAETSYLKNGTFGLDTLKLIERLNKLDEEFIPSDFLKLIDSENAFKAIPTTELISIKRNLRKIKKNKKIILNPEIPLKSRILHLSIVENSIEYIYKTITLEYQLLRGLVEESKLKELKKNISDETMTVTY